MSVLSSFLSRGLVPMSSLFIDKSDIFTYDKDMMALVILVGGGGSGGASFMGTGANQGKLAAVGGNGGGVAIQLLRIQAGLNYEFTIPAAAEGVPASGVSTGLYPEYTGNDGGDTTLELPSGVIITAKGGKGGTALAEDGNYSSPINITNTTQTVWGANADIVFPGGLGGTVAQANTAALIAHAVASGGGAANILGAPSDRVSGGIVLCINAAVRGSSASGGGGVNGRGGHTLDDNVGGNGANASGGGGSGGDAPDVARLPSNASAEGDGGIAFPVNNNSILAPNGIGGNASGNSSTIAGNGGSGGGGGGCAKALGGDFEPQTRGGNGGIFGGGGGACGGAVNDNIPVYGGHGGYGGGGGGSCNPPAATNATGKTNGRSGNGGAGCAFVFFFTDFGKVVI